MSYLHNSNYFKEMRVTWTLYAWQELGTEAPRSSATFTIQPHVHVHMPMASTPAPQRTLVEVRMCIG